MDLHYSVYIDTDQAKKSTGDLVELFKKMEQSTDKEVKKLGELGSRFVKEMENGTHTTKETAIALGELEKKVTSLGASAGKIGFSEKRNLRATAEELRKVQVQVQQLEQVRTKAHNKNIRQMKEEQVEQAKVEAGTRASTRTARFIRASTRANLSVGSLASMARFGAAGVAVGGIIGAGKEFYDRYKDSFKWIFDGLRNTMDNFKHVLDGFVAKFVDDKVDADENLYNGKVNRWREEYEQSKKDVEALHKTETNAIELSNAFERLKKAVPEFAGMKDFTALVKGNQQEQLKAVQEAFSEKLGKEVVDFLVKNKASESEEYKTWYKLQRIAEADRKAFEEVGKGSPNDTTALEKLRKKASRSQDRANEAYEKYKNSDAYQLYEQERNAIIERISNENKVSHYLKDQAEAEKKAKEANERRQKALDSLNALAQDTNPETFAETYAKIEKMREKELQQVEKIRAKYGEEPEVLQAAEEAEKRIIDKAEKMREKVAEEEREVWEELQEILTGQTATAIEKTIRGIRKEYEARRKELAQLYKDNPAKQEEAKQLLDEAEAIEVENAKLEENIRLIKEAEKERADAIETSGKFTSTIEEEVAAIDNEIDSLRKQNAALIEQKNISAEELNLIAKNIAGQVKLNKQKQEALRLDKEQKKLTRLDKVGQYGGLLASSNNEYLQALGQATQAYTAAKSSALEYKNSQDYGERKTIRAQQMANAAQATIQFGMDLWNSFSESAKKSKAALEEWNAKVADSAHRLAVLTLEEYEYKQRNLFGIDDPYKPIVDSLNKQNAAQVEASKALDKMAKEGVIQVGTKKKADGKEVAQLAASGAVAGAAIGAMAGPIGAAIGTAAGGIVGAVAGIFSSRKEVAVYDSLAGKYGEVYNRETLEINKQILADYDKMDDATKKLIDNAQELLDIQKEAQEDYNAYISDLVGEMGTEISQRLAEAFRNKDIFAAMDNIRDYLAEVISGHVQAATFNAVFGDYFDGLDRQFKNVGAGGNIDQIDEVITGMNYRLNELIPRYAEIMKRYQDMYKAQGYDIFASNEQTQQALQGTIAGMSEDTAGKINGNFMGLKLSAMEANSHLKDIKEHNVSHFAEVNAMMHRSLDTLQAIAENTFESQITAKEMRDFMRRWDNDGLRVK